MFQNIHHNSNTNQLIKIQQHELKRSLNMAKADEFIKYCIQALEVNFGQISKGIITKAQAKKKLDDKSNISDYKEFVDLLELDIRVLSGNNKATEICNVLRTHLLDTLEPQKPAAIPISADIDKEIDAFLARTSLPSESDISDYAKFLTIKFGVEAKRAEKDVIEKVKTHVKDGINRKKILEELDNFLTKFPQPTENDVGDFVNYIRLLKIDFPSDQLRDMVEKERLYRKFHEEGNKTEKTTFDRFIENAKTLDKKELGKAMQKQGITYLIKDEKGISDNLLSEYAELLTPSEKDTRDTLEGLGLKHMIKKK